MSIINMSTSNRSKVYENMIKKDKSELESRLDVLLKREEEYKTKISDEKASLNIFKQLKDSGQTIDESNYNMD